MKSTLLYTKKTFQRAAVFDEYGNSFGAIDANNNICDNMASFHDVMRTHNREHRSFAFFWALAEANAFLAWRKFGPRDLRNMDHCDFRERIAQEILIAYSNEGYDDENTEDNKQHELVRLPRADCVWKRRRLPLVSATTWLTASHSIQNISLIAHKS